MPLPSILKKASSYILGDCGNDNRKTQYHDGETLFCKNNVCVHPPSLIRQHCDVIHHPGYMTITCRIEKTTNQPNLHLSWIPNTTLHKHPTTLENNLLKKSCNGNDDTDDNHKKDKIFIEEGKNDNDERIDVCLEVKEPVNWQDCEKICSSSRELFINNNNNDDDTKVKKLNDDKDKKLVLNNNDDHQGIMINMNRLRSESIDSSKSAIITDNEIINLQKTRSLSVSSCSPSIGDPDFPSWMKSPELLALQHNLTFPESTTASPVTIRRTYHRCRRFSVDLGQMKSVRLFFSDADCTSGQLVVASPESQYKIFHLHFGGLDKLASILHQWHQLLFPQQINNDNADNTSLPYRHFMVCRPEIARSELHPEEGQVPMITSLMWKDLLNEKGQIEDDLTLRKGIFFSGCDPSLRKLIWPFLLHCYSYQSTYDDRQQIDKIRYQEYQEIQHQRINMNPEDKEYFWRHVVCIVEKDVVRTDRANPYYAGDNNPNINIMKNILLNYAVYNSRIGYSQGMSDLLSPLLAELNCEVDAFWCFAGLMQRSITVCTPTDTDMDRNLCYLRELIKIMIPNFYQHLDNHTDALELLFCHRWILLCLKREFPTDIALAMWQSCWVNYLTDYFHLFLCLSIMCVYADDVIAQNLRTDEMLLHFSSLAMYMDGNVVLRKARGLLYQFRQLDRLPCTLAGLCRQCGPGMWDSSHNPVIECHGHEQLTCPNAENYDNLKY